MLRNRPRGGAGPQERRGSRRGGLVVGGAPRGRSLGGRGPGRCGPLVGRAQRGASLVGGVRGGAEPSKGGGPGPAVSPAQLWREAGGLRGRNPQGAWPSLPISASPVPQAARTLPPCSVLASMSFVPVAEDSDFPIHNLPYGVFSTRGNVSCSARFRARGGREYPPPGTPTLLPRPWPQSSLPPLAGTRPSWMWGPSFPCSSPLAKTPGVVGAP